MGGRGASSGMSIKGKKYGTEYTTLLTHDNIKFVRYNDSKAAKTPMETMTDGRIYVTVNNQDEIKSITFYDSDNKRNMQIDVSGNAHKINGKRIIPHVHEGYYHNEHGDRKLSNVEKNLLDKIISIWDDREK